MRLYQDRLRYLPNYKIYGQFYKELKKGQKANFRKNSYSKMIGNGYFETIQNPGKYGEYLVYKELKAYERDGGKFLSNCYLPKDDGTTTEIDVILIHATGIFAVESKNYSGWIFGSEKSVFIIRSCRIRHILNG